MNITNFFICLSLVHAYAILMQFHNRIRARRALQKVVPEEEKLKERISIESWDPMCHVVRLNYPLCHYWIFSFLQQAKDMEALIRNTYTLDTVKGRQQFYNEMEDAVIRKRYYVQVVS